MTFRRYIAPIKTVNTIDSERYPHLTGVCSRVSHPVLIFGNPLYYPRNSFRELVQIVMCAKHLVDESLSVALICRNGRPTSTDGKSTPIFILAYRLVPSTDTMGTQCKIELETQDGIRLMPYCMQVSGEKHSYLDATSQFRATHRIATQTLTDGLELEDQVLRSTCTTQHSPCSPTLQ